MASLLAWSLSKLLSCLESWHGSSTDSYLSSRMLKHGKLYIKGLQEIMILSTWRSSKEKGIWNSILVGLMPLLKINVQIMLFKRYQSSARSLIKSLISLTKLTETTLQEIFRSLSGCKIRSGDQVQYKAARNWPFEANHPMQEVYSSQINPQITTAKETTLKYATKINSIKWMRFWLRVEMKVW